VEQLAVLASLQELVAQGIEGYGHEQVVAAIGRERNAGEAQAERPAVEERSARLLRACQADVHRGAV
jgi:hypothetical protein